MDILEMVFLMLVVVLLALLWFFVNRASVRANEQIHLLKEIVEQQRVQTACLTALVPGSLIAAEVVAPTTPPESSQPEVPDIELDAFNVIPER